MQYNAEFWNALDELVNNYEIIIDIPKELLQDAMIEIVKGE